MIARVWRGWTAPNEADAYETLIRTAIFPGILARRVAGLRGLELHRRDLGEETEFMTLMRFETLEAVKDFAGPEWEVAVVPPAARAVLARFEPTAAHFETRVAVDA